MKFSKQFLLVAVMSFLTAGCVSNQQYRQETRSLQQQVNQLTREINRLSGQLRVAQDSSAQAQAKVALLDAQIVRAKQTRVSTPAGSEFASAAVYRTPSGFEVLAIDIQRALRRAGYEIGKLDGKVGPQTREALRQFQRDHDLTVDGVCGRKTWEQLRIFLPEAGIK